MFWRACKAQTKRMSNNQITIKTEAEIEILRAGGAILAKVLRELEKAVKPGISTKDLEDLARALCKKYKSTPAFLDYQPEGADRPYPAALCVSVNDEVVHGIPNEHPRVLALGDVLVLDMGLIYKKLFVDSAITVIVGGKACGDEAALKLIAAAEAGLSAAIDMMKPGVRTGDIGEAIERAVKSTGKPYRFSLPEILGGHGVGYGVHEAPFIPNVGKPGQGPILKAGMVLAVEPIVNEGSPEVYLASDDWTYKTADKKRSAHVEHTLVVTEDGVEVLTA